MFIRRRGIGIALGALAAGGCGESVIDQAIERACEVVSTCNEFGETYRTRCIGTARAIADDDGRPLDCATAYARYLLCVYDVDCATYLDARAHDDHIYAECFEELREIYATCP